MLVGIGFISVLTATIATRFVRSDTGGDTSEMQATLCRIEEELIEIKARLSESH